MTFTIMAYQALAAEIGGYSTSSSACHCNTWPARIGPAECAAMAGCLVSELLRVS
jgi:hypothetical protein